MSLVPPALDGVTADQTNAAPRDWAHGSLVFVCSLTAIVLVLVVNAVLRGPWLDEFWTLELADTRKSAAQLVDGWLRDTHSPTFNLLGDIS
ncbi:hypothetical protein [Reyranella sp.]|uniref:hypothetical protein n=1 Tax=Reyranella sp. TaxID=1929291 RepID=UPI0025E4EC5F|nr:hypothetical protein [Reyranella sp.]